MKLTWLTWLLTIITAAVVVAIPLDRDNSGLTTLVARSISTAAAEIVIATPLTSRSVEPAPAKENPCETFRKTSLCALKATFLGLPWNWKKNFKECILKCIAMHKYVYHDLPPDGTPPSMPPPNMPPPNQPPPKEDPLSENEEIQRENERLEDENRNIVDDKLEREKNQLEKDKLMKEHDKLVEENLQLLNETENSEKSTYKIRVEIQKPVEKSPPNEQYIKPIGTNVNDLINIKDHTNINDRRALSAESLPLTAKTATDTASLRIPATSLTKRGCSFFQQTGCSFKATWGNWFQNIMDNYEKCMNKCRDEEDKCDEEDDDDSDDDEYYV